MTTDKAPLGRPATCLYLYPADGGNPHVMELQAGADPVEVERAIRDCARGEFVAVPAVFSNGWEEMNFHVQPHQWGAWLIGTANLNDATPR